MDDILRAARQAQSGVDDEESGSTMASARQFKEFAVAKLACKPGDTLVFRIPNISQASPGWVTGMKNYIESLIPPGIKILFMDENVEITVIRTESIDRSGKSK